MKELDNEVFRELIIEEYNTYYLVKLIGQDVDELSIRYDKDSGDYEVIDFVKLFLGMGKINRLVNKSMIYGESTQSKFFEVGNLEKQILKINLHGTKFRYLSDMILQKYINDRHEFLNSCDVKEIRLNAINQNFMYEQNGELINVNLCVDANGNLLRIEREAMRDFLYEKFDSIGEEVIVEMKKGKYGESLECVVTCGDFKISFPRTYTFSLIVGIINDYNNNNYKSKKR